MVQIRRVVPSDLSHQPLILWADLPDGMGCFCRDRTTSGYPGFFLSIGSRERILSHYEVARRLGVRVPGFSPAGAVCAQPTA